MFFDEEDGGDAQLPSFSILARRVDDAFPTAAALFAEDLADGTKPWTPFEVFEAMRAVVSSKDLAIMVTYGDACLFFDVFLSIDTDESKDSHSLSFGNMNAVYVGSSHVERRSTAVQTPF